MGKGDYIFWKKKFADVLVCWCAGVLVCWCANEILSDPYQHISTFSNQQIKGLSS
jgi:hypothetical protein